jgi:uracil-DNA glycosylase family 4
MEAIRQRNLARRLRLSHPWSGFVSDRTLLMGRLVPSSAFREPHPDEPSAPDAALSSNSEKSLPSKHGLEDSQARQTSTSPSLICHCSSSSPAALAHLPKYTGPIYPRIFFLVDPSAEPSITFQKDQASDRPLESKYLENAQSQLLTRMMDAMGLDQTDRSVWPLLRCQGSPTSCGGVLQEGLRELDLQHPEVVVALGEAATQALLGGTTHLSQARGHLFNRDGIKVIPSHSLGALLTQPHLKRETWLDLQLAAFELGLTLPKR